MSPQAQLYKSLNQIHILAMGLTPSKKRDSIIRITDKTIQDLNYHSFSCTNLNDNSFKEVCICEEVKQ